MNIIVVFFFNISRKAIGCPEKQNKTKTDNQKNIPSHNIYHLSLLLLEW